MSSGETASSQRTSQWETVAEGPLLVLASVSQQREKALGPLREPAWGAGGRLEEPAGAEAAAAGSSLGAQRGQTVFSGFSSFLVV